MVYQNVVHGAGTGVRQDQLKVIADKFYNNTLYNVSECYESDTDSGGWTKTVEYFNNICVKDRGTKVVDWDNQDTGTADVDGQSYLNNNLYQLKGTAGNSYVNKGTSRTGIASWKTYLKDTLGLSSSLNEDVSSEADPLLVNPAAFDYRLQTSSPAKTGGRGGAYSTVRGAYIAGTEIIGCTFSPLCHGYGSGGGDAAPSDVENARRSDTR